MTTTEIIGTEKKNNLLFEAVSEHPSYLVKRCVFEKIPLSIDEIDEYLEIKESKGEPVDRIWLLKRFADAHLLDAPQHLIKLITKQTIQ